MVNLGKYLSPSSDGVNFVRNFADGLNVAESQQA
jgi:hypothetical protein